MNKKPILRSPKCWNYQKKTKRIILIRFYKAKVNIIEMNGKIEVFTKEIKAIKRTK